MDLVFHPKELCDFTLSYLDHHIHCHRYVLRKSSLLSSLFSNSGNVTLDLVPRSNILGSLDIKSLIYTLCSIYKNQSINLLSDDFTCQDVIDFYTLEDSLEYIQNTEKDNESLLFSSSQIIKQNLEVYHFGIYSWAMYLGISFLWKHYFTFYDEFVQKIINIYYSYCTLTLTYQHDHHDLFNSFIYFYVCDEMKITLDKTQVLFQIIRGKQEFDSWLSEVKKDHYCGILWDHLPESIKIKLINKFPDGRILTYVAIHGYKRKNGIRCELVLLNYKQGELHGQSHSYHACNQHIFEKNGIYIHSTQNNEDDLYIVILDPLIDEYLNYFEYYHPIEIVNYDQSRRMGLCSEYYHDNWSLKLVKKSIVFYHDNGVIETLKKWDQKGKEIATFKT